MKQTLKWGTVLFGFCLLCLVVWKINTWHRHRTSLLGFTNVTEKTWPNVARKVSDLRTERRHTEETKYDSQKIGRMTPELLATYQREHILLVEHEMANVERSLLQRFDKNHDGELSEDELKEVLDAFRDTEKEQQNSNRRKLKRYLTQVRFLDADNDGLISDGETDVSIRLEYMARSLTNTMRKRFLDISELKKENENRVQECKSGVTANTVQKETGK